MENWFLSVVDLLRYLYRLFIRVEGNWNISIDDMANVYNEITLNLSNTEIFFI